MNLLMTAALLAAGAVLALAALAAGNAWVRRRQNRAPRESRAKQPTETMKRVVWVCVINGFAWVWCSYILAALDRAQIAEELSKVALVEIIVPVAVYAFKSVVENLSKNNSWPDRSADPSAGPQTETEDEKL